MRTAVQLRDTVALLLGVCALVRCTSRVPPAPASPPAAASLAPPETRASSSVPSRISTPAPSPFCLLARARGGATEPALRLFPLARQSVLVTTSAPAILCDASGACGLVSPGAALPADIALRDVHAAAGDWGREVWLTLGAPAGEGEHLRVAHFSGGRWREEMRTARGYWPTYPLLAASDDGRIAGLAMFMVDGVRATAMQIKAGPPGAYRLDVLSGAAAASLPVVAANETPTALALRSGGESIVLIDRVVAATGHPIALVRGPGVRREIALPAPPGASVGELEVSVLAPMPQGPFYAAGMVEGTRRAYVARVEGDQAEVLEVPETLAGISAATVEPGGSLWVVASGEVHTLSAAGRWHPVPLAPSPRGARCAATAIVARAAGDVLVTVRCADDVVEVRRTGCPTGVVTGGTWGATFE